MVGLRISANWPILLLPTLKAKQFKFELFSKKAHAYYLVNKWLTSTLSWAIWFPKKHVITLYFKVFR